jgi:uncharacterized protein DUF222/HNH endonuclease
MPQAVEQVAHEVTLFAHAVEAFCLTSHRSAGHELALDLPEVSGCLNLLQLKFSKMATSFAATDEYDVQGSLSTIHWIRLDCNVAAGAAADRVTVGEQLEHVPESADAIAAGDIRFAHLALIAREAEALSESGNRQFDETALLAKAKDYSVGRFRNFCHHQRHAGDPAGYAAAQAEAVESRSLSLNTGEGGMLWIRGVLDPEGGAILKTALDPLAARAGKHNDRKRDHRLADALVELAQHGQRSQLQVTASLETLLQRAGASAADVELSLPLSDAAVECLARDCNVTRLLLAANSQVIDVGRSSRTVQAPTRRALDARDKGCRWPGCDRPASWTAAHHLVHWSRGGPTDLSNLVLLRHRHHWLVYEGGWQLVKADEGELLAIPPQMDLFDHLARGPDAQTA